MFLWHYCETLRIYLLLITIGQNYWDVSEAMVRHFWDIAETLLKHCWDISETLGRITTLVLCRQSPLNLHQFRLTRDSKYGLVGTDRNAIWRYFALIRLYLALLFILSITQKFLRHYWHIAKIFLVHKWCIEFLRLFADVTCFNLFNFFSYWLIDETFTDDWAIIQFKYWHVFMAKPLNWKANTNRICMART